MNCVFCDETEGIQLCVDCEDPICPDHTSDEGHCTHCDHAQEDDDDSE